MTISTVSASYRSLSWQQQLAEAITDPFVLCQALALDPGQIASSAAAVGQFPLRVPQAFLVRMERGNLNDPLLRQVLPLGVEMQAVVGYGCDPLDEARFRVVPGLLHKYYGRVLLTLAGACAVHCRYCFRRHYPYADEVPGLSQWQPALDYIRADRSIQEVILSGGDPLIVKDTMLRNFVAQLETIPQLTRLRIHTRLPIVIPDRMTDALLKLFEDSRLAIVLVLHSNHANELDDTVAAAMARCRGMTVLNQAVLLRGVNDTADALVNLSYRLFDCGILPYYLHLLDPVAGTAHFNVTATKARELMQAVIARLPGYLVPKLVREVSGAQSKQLIL